MNANHGMKKKKKRKKKGKGKLRSKVEPKDNKCYSCGKTYDFIKDYYKDKNKQKMIVRDDANAVSYFNSNHSDVYVLIKPLYALLLLLFQSL